MPSLKEIEGDISPVFDSGELLVPLASSESFSSGFSVGIDWFSVSFQTSHSFDTLFSLVSDFLPPILFLSSASVSSVIRSYDATYHIFSKSSRAKVFGNLSVRYSEPGVTYYLSFTGSFFSIVDQQASKIFDLISDDEHFFSVRVHRVDICLDDFLNALNLFERIPDAYQRGFFTVTCPPSYSTYQHNDDSSGNTVYIGKRASSKMVRCYQKGVFLGDSSSEWVRLEIQYRRSESTLIPLDVLVRPQAYFFSTYPRFFGWLFDEVFPSLPKQEKEQSENYSMVSAFGIQFGKKFRFVRNQCGHYIYGFRKIFQDFGLTDSEILDFFCRHAPTHTGFPVVLESYFISSESESELHHQLDDVILHFLDTITVL